MKKGKNKHYTIAIITGNTQSDYSKKLTEGFYDAAKNEDVNLILLTEQELPPYCIDIITDNTATNYRYQFHSIYQYTNFIKPDAAIITYGSISAFTSKTQKENFLSLFSNIPYLMLEDTAQDTNVPYLSTDNYNGMSECVEHLIQHHGYKNIAFLSGPIDNHDARERLQAYLSCMERHQLHVADTMIAYGNFTDCVDNQVLYLLENNPNIEAIVCANDAMAKSCYHVCTLQNLIIGKDIAITGFDNISSAVSMNPPLTSVSQNIFQLGYSALKTIVAMCNGEKVSPINIQAALKTRCSCGCSPISIFHTKYTPNSNMESYIKMVLESMSQKLFSSVFHEQERNYLTTVLSDYFFYIYDTVFLDTPGNFNMEYLLRILKELASQPYVSNNLLIEYIIQLLKFLQSHTHTDYSRSIISSIITSSQQFIHSLAIEKLEHEIILSNRKAWFVPTFTKNLVHETYIHNLQNAFHYVMVEMRKMNVRSIYFFLFDTPVIHKENEPLIFPETINLAAYFDSDTMKCYDQKDYPTVSKQTGLLSLIEKEKPTFYTTVILYSGLRQYGFMICDIDHEDIPFLQMCSLQIGTLLHFIELNRLERQTQEKLHNSLELIEEKNKILSFLSEYDELTKLLNRRGFIERALSLCTTNVGKTAYLIFGDLDHLKEINDVFGHVEGDFAIKIIANYFLSALPKNTVCGRIGGDEFIAFLITDETDFKNQTEKKFIATAKEFNDNSQKPYYIEISLGIYEFTCTEQINFDELMKQSDKLLYEAKTKRRKSIQK